MRSSAECMHRVALLRLCTVVRCIQLQRRSTSKARARLFLSICCARPCTTYCPVRCWLIVLSAHYDFQPRSVTCCDCKLLTIIASHLLSLSVTHCHCHLLTVCFQMFSCANLGTRTETEFRSLQRSKTCGTTTKRSRRNCRKEQELLACQTLHRSSTQRSPKTRCISLCHPLYASHCLCTSLPVLLTSCELTV